MNEASVSMKEGYSSGRLGASVHFPRTSPNPRKVLLAWCRPIVRSTTLLLYMLTMVAVPALGVTMPALAGGSHTVQSVERLPAKPARPELALRKHLASVKFVACEPTGSASPIESDGAESLCSRLRHDSTLVTPAYHTLSRAQRAPPRHSIP